MHRRITEISLNLSCPFCQSLFFKRLRKHGIWKKCKNCKRRFKRFYGKIVDMEYPDLVKKILQKPENADRVRDLYNQGFIFNDITQRFEKDELIVYPVDIFMRAKQEWNQFLENLNNRIKK